MDKKIRINIISDESENDLSCETKTFSIDERFENSEIISVLKGGLDTLAVSDIKGAKELVDQTPGIESTRFINEPTRNFKEKSETAALIFAAYEILLKHCSKAQEIGLDVKIYLNYSAKDNIDGVTDVESAGGDITIKDTPLVYKYRDDLKISTGSYGKQSN